MSENNYYNFMTPERNNDVKHIFDIDIESLNAYSLQYVICGVYFLYDGEDLVYIGKSKDIRGRIHIHQQEGLKKFDSYKLLRCDEDSSIVERLLINKYLPKYNKDSITKIIRETQNSEK